MNEILKLVIWLVTITLTSSLTSIFYLVAELKQMLMQDSLAMKNSWRVRRLVFGRTDDQHDEEIPHRGDQVR